MYKLETIADLEQILVEQKNLRKPAGKLHLLHIHVEVYETDMNGTITMHDHGLQYIDLNVQAKHHDLQYQMLYLNLTKLKQ